MPLDRRRFLHTAALAGAALAVGSAPAEDGKKEPRLKKAVKFDMIKIKGSNKDKLELVKRLGFLGVEVNSPEENLDKKDLVAASKDTGVVIHGVIDSVHWKPTHTLSSSNPACRARGLEALLGGLEDAKLYGADDVLLVPGQVNKDATFDQCWERSQTEIQKALPVAEKYGVKIAIEVVWNDFLTSPEQFVKYIDSFKNPYLGGYFDCSNMVKYGVKPGDWIRALGKRMVKFDFKGYSKARGWVAIGEGDEDWPDILKALEEIGYHGWATAEVNGGGEKELKDVADRMNRILGL